MSAGGLAACSTFLRHTPPDTGLPFVLVQHLDPHHDSLLVGLLARTTTMPVVKIEDGMTLLPGRVHVIPPDAALTCENGALRLLPRTAARPPMPIDGFLRALAEDQGPRVIAVILSGTGSDGAHGVESVREHGGVTLAQEPGDAEFEGMPRAAIATGCVDTVLPSARMGAEVARIARELEAGERRDASGGDPPWEQSALPELLALLRTASGIDFARYRLTTVRRRLQRRIGLRGLAGVTDYVAYVRANPSELQELARDLLIAVTRFFRDPEVFEFLGQTAFPDLIRRAQAGDTVRLWVPGCATGEEAYSLAITFTEAAQRMHSKVACQVFATDINENVLEAARRGTYLENIATDVSTERLARFFTHSQGQYRIQRSIRDLCIFSRHDLLRDPPLSRMDLVSCRNLLIYLEGAGREALRLLHFALEPRGYLLLGRSETAANCPELYEPVDKDVRLFRSLETVAGRTFPRGLGTREATRRAAPQLPLEMPPDSTAFEELIAANEELQSLNEELESSKEEIESVNEELLTVNQELRSRNAALHVAHEFSAATLDTVRSGLLVLDHEHVVVNANRSFYRLFQLTPAEVEQRSIAAVAPEYFTAPALVELLQKARTTAEVQSDVEIEFHRPGHGHRVLLVSVRSFAPGDQFLLSIDDVTQVRELEAERRQAQKMEAIGHLAAGVAHDFNNLLTPILAGSQLAMTTLEADSPMREIVEGIGIAARRAADLTRQLLAYAGKSRAYLERVGLSDIVQHTANLLHGSLPPHLHLRLDLDRELPPLLADRSQLHQIVDNLVQNAIEAIGDGEGAVVVRTGRQTIGRERIPGLEPGTWTPTGEYVFVEVQDTGCGMSQDTVRQMFDPFFTTKFTGRGLGLAAVQGIVRQHRGTMLVHSILGRGTSVRVLLSTNPGKPGAATTLTPVVARSGAGTILLVDDEALVRQTISIALERFGYTVITAASGQQALDVLKSHPAISAIVLDATMPDMNGAETLQAIRQLRAGLPVLVCSGLGDAAVEHAFEGQGAIAFLHKPFTLDTLAAKLAGILGPQP